MSQRISADRVSGGQRPPAGGGGTSALRRLRSSIASSLGFRIWYGIGLETWLPLLRRHYKSLSVWQVPRAALFTLLSAFSSLVGLFSRLIFARRIRQVRLHPAPIFVLGHWRTGTTFLHELLASDPRHIFPKGYQCGTPHLFLLLETSFRPLLGYALPERRPMDDMVLDLERPQEDEYALLGLVGRSTLRSFIFPGDGPVDGAYLSLRKLDDKARAAWKEAWVYFLKSVAIRHGNDRRLVLKSPQHTARVRTILEVFPDAKFIHLVRNPHAVFASTVRTWQILSDTQGLQGSGAADPWVKESVLATFEEMYRCYEEDRALIPTGNLYELRYEDLAADPMSALGDIYRALDLGEATHWEGPVARRVLESSDYKVRRHQLDPADAALVARRWADFIARYPYQDDVAGALRADKQ